ncbi:hypothetical protein ABTY59_14630 [Streptomyces sp. NPDC096079]|uniref:hypothetical protein n=1 Tax=Streptomyces sp. NPDC096079 TaxID=3155820 RepID=UPI0033190D38
MLELAAAEGRDPADPERAAELLVLQGVYEDTAQAMAALDTRSPRPRTQAGRGRTATLWDLIMRMAKLLGLLTPDDVSPSRLVRVGQWVLVACVFLVGLVAPLVWLPYMAVSYNRATTRLMDRATVFYVGSRDLAPPRRVRLDAAMAAAGLRALGSMVLPLAGLLVVAATDTRIAGGQLPVAGIILAASCLLTGGWWLWRRHRRRREAPPP